MIRGEAWNDVNTLLAFLTQGTRSVPELVDDFYLLYGNSAPGELLRQQIAKVQQHLDEGYRR